MPGICSVEDCQLPSEAKGWCKNHYNRWYRTGDPLGVKSVAREGASPCSVEGCDTPSYAKGWCRPHYQRWLRYKDPLGVPEKKKRRSPTVKRPPKPMAERLWPRVDTSDTHGCWPWTGSRRHAYGEVEIGGKKHYAHRLMYEHVYGPLDPDLNVCHKCDNPICVRPDHLFAGTQGDNMRDMSTKGRWGNKTKIGGEDSGYVRNRDRRCVEPGCLNPVSARDLCGAHYQRERKKRLGL